MRGYIKSVTKTFEQGTSVEELTAFVHKQLSVDHPYTERIEKRYRVTIAEIEDYDEDSVTAIRSANLRKGRTVRWKGSKIIKNEMSKQGQ